MKKTFFITLLFLLLIIPVLVFAGGVGCPSPTEGMVPCGNSPDCPCELCDLFVMFDRIIKELLLKIVPVLAALMVVVGGAYYIISQGSPDKLNKAKSLFVSITIGLLIIYGAWLLVNLFLMTINVAEWTGLKGGWWKIECSSSAPTIPTIPTIPTGPVGPIILDPCALCPGNEIESCQEFICISLGEDCEFTPGAVYGLGICSKR